MPHARDSVLREGLVAGVIGAAVVALWFLFVDLARGAPLFTPALLGAAVFFGATTPGGVAIADLTGEQVANIGSQTMTNDVWVKLAQQTNAVPRFDLHRHRIELAALPPLDPPVPWSVLQGLRAGP